METHKAGCEARNIEEIFPLVQKEYHLIPPADYLKYLSARRREEKYR
jgi:hypothetical protein